LNNKKRLSEEEAKSIFLQIAKGVMVCHKKGIIHRDLKLDNFVFIDSQKTWVKVDIIYELKIITIKLDY